MTTLALLALALGPAALPELFEKVDPSVVAVAAGARTEVKTENVRMSGITVSTGSGVLVHAQGYVVTAAHVVDDAEAIEVYWRDGFSASARVVSLSRTEDLALLKVEQTPKKAVVATLGDSGALKVGQRVFAIGMPYGLVHSLTVGVVSGLRTSPRKGLQPQHLVQTDVAINQGNSGGPIFNEQGEVVGIASFMLSKSGGSVGLNFAVPSNTVRTRLFDEALPYLGVTLRFIPKDIAELFNWPVEGGFLVEAVLPGSAAAEAGLRAGEADAVVAGNEVKLGGDLIVKVNGLDAWETAQVAAALRALKPGDTLRYHVLRKGQPEVVDVKLPEGLAVPTLPRPPKR